MAPNVAGSIPVSHPKTYIAITLGTTQIKPCPPIFHYDKPPDVLVVENEQEVFTAMIALKKGQGSFADSVIAELGARRGCSRTLTFDPKAGRLPGFELL